MIPFGWNNIWILFLVGLLPLALGLGLMLIYVVMQERFQGDERGRDEEKEKA
jgi:hypothetical protein